MSSSHGFADLGLSVFLANRIEASLKNLSPDRFEYFVKQVGLESEIHFVLRVT